MNLRSEVRKAEKLLKEALDKAGIKHSKEEDLPRGLSMTRVVTARYAKPKYKLIGLTSTLLHEVIHQNALIEFIEHCIQNKIKHVTNANVWVQENPYDIEFAVEGYAVPDGEPE